MGLSNQFRHDQSSSFTDCTRCTEPLLLTQGLSPSGPAALLPVFSGLWGCVTLEEGVVRGSLIQTLLRTLPQCHICWCLQYRVCTTPFSSCVLEDKRCNNKALVWKKRELGTVIIMKTCHSNLQVKFLCKIEKISLNSALRSLIAQERHQGTDSCTPLK